jgi:D-alanyl-D-alanine carboxypeptidase
MITENRKGIRRFLFWKWITVCIVISSIIFFVIRYTNKKPTSLREIVVQTVKKNNIPGISAIIITSDKIIDMCSFGLRHKGFTDSILVTDLFQIGSNTKAMTTTMLAILIEKGKLRWDTKILEVFPEWKDRINPNYNDITLADLLTHQAGIPEYSNFSYLFNGKAIRDDGTQHLEEDRNAWKEMTSYSGTPMEQRRAFALNLLSRKPVVPPHTKFLYSNVGYGIASALAERVTGESWEMLMQKYLLSPLEIRATFDWPATNDPNQPWGHFKTDTGFRAHDPHDEFHLPACLLPGGGISMSLIDYSKFLQLHLKGLKGENGLLKAETIRHLHTKMINMGDAYSYAFGWVITDFDGALANLHTGSAGTFNAAVALWPSRNLAIAVFANTGSISAQTPAFEIIKKANHLYISKVK